ncbi:MAG: hypothetical protein AAB518_00595 [Patescibacteria group bacterium]
MARQKNPFRHPELRNAYAVLCEYLVEDRLISRHKFFGAGAIEAFSRWQAEHIAAKKFRKMFQLPERTKICCVAERTPDRTPRSSPPTSTVPHKPRPIQGTLFSNPSLIH